MVFADALEDNANFMMNWYVWVPCVGLIGLLLMAGLVTLLVVLVKALGRPRRRDD